MNSPPGSRLDRPEVRTDTPALCVGTVSRNTIDAAIDVAYRTKRPLMLIASRRQADRDPFRGYVEQWSTRELAQYVRSRDPERRVVLCRDHGGPWQRPEEIRGGLGLEQALESAASSLREDIDCGFSLLHLDTSVDPRGGVPPPVASARLVELYERTATYAAASDHDVAFEIGFEDQRPAIAAPKAFARSLAHVLLEIERRGLPRPTYVVAQTGTKVVGTRNIGHITSEGTAQATRSRLAELVQVCVDAGVSLKAHNCDYLGFREWALLGQAGPGGANVAPEYGVVETKTWLTLLGRCGLREERARFVAAVDRSGRWRKWTMGLERTTPVERALIAGHYVFSERWFADIRSAAARRLGVDEDELDALLRQPVANLIERHVDWLAVA